MKFLIALSILVCSTLSMRTTIAADSSSGCGPGWYIMRENSILSSALRATTNAVLFPTTTIGMTIGTSNCSKHKLVKTEMESLHFATHNYFEIKSELASANGTYLSALSETLGCQNQRDLTQKLRQNYSKLFQKNADGENLLFNIYKVILSDQQLLNSCSTT